jgi:hypothetical protein
MVKTLTHAQDQIIAQTGWQSVNMLTDRSLRDKNRSHLKE